MSENHALIGIYKLYIGQYTRRTTLFNEIEIIWEINMELFFKSVFSVLYHLPQNQLNKYSRMFEIFTTCADIHNIGNKYIPSHLFPPPSYPL